MSDATLIRVWADYGSPPMTAFVDWNDGRFSLPDDHPIAKKVWGSADLLGYRVTVYSTDELEWLIDSIWTSQSGHQFNCIPRRAHLRACLRSDDYLIEVWLSAEKKWQEGRAERDALVDQLVHIFHEAHIRGDYEDYARHLVESGWRKGEPA